jgi:hypothetical protein
MGEIGAGRNGQSWRGSTAWAWTHGGNLGEVTAGGTLPSKLSHAARVRARTEPDEAAELDNLVDAEDGEHDI